MKELFDVDVVIIGSGLSGLSAAYDLGKRGYSVALFEQNDFLGGLASSFKFDGQSIERFYHFICRADYEYFKLLEELGIRDALTWETSITKYFYQGKLFDFSTPFDLITFSAIPFWGRIRFGINIIKDRYHKQWQTIDGISAKDWLIGKIGEKAYDVIWDPLLKVKFGEYYDQISAAWMWHRIWRVAKSRKYIWQPEKLAYLQGGTQTLVNALVENIHQYPNVRIRTEAKVTELNVVEQKVNYVGLQNGEKISCKYVVSTIPLNALKKIISPTTFQDVIEQYDYIAVVCGLLKLKHKVTDGFWVNINDTHVPFNGIIEYSNLNREIGKEENCSYVYIPYYLNENHPRFKFSDKKLLQEFSDGLKRINSKFTDDWIIDYKISRAKNAQAICYKNFKQIKPEIFTDIDGLFITDSTLYYPEDRTVSASIKLGRKVAEYLHDTRKNV